MLTTNHGFGPKPIKQKARHDWLLLFTAVMGWAVITQSPTMLPSARITESPMALEVTTFSEPPLLVDDLFFHEFRPKERAIGLVEVGNFPTIAD